MKLQQNQVIFCFSWSKNLDYFSIPRWPQKGSNAVPEDYVIYAVHEL